MSADRSLKQRIALSLFIASSFERPLFAMYCTMRLWNHSSTVISGGGGICIVIGFKSDFIWSYWKPVSGLCLNDEDRAIVPDQLYLVTFSAVAMVRPEVAEAITL
jgi:hypothetical protein